ncbi:MAG: hypothetical protein APR63_08165 [Desulfuromonas sp. SDB]|nr:MAG: hypothetical protein APR63_08165 [Desulfuromonas sp. SDB]
MTKLLNRTITFLTPRMAFDLYIIKQMIMPFSLSLFVYTFVLIMNRLFELVDLIFGKGLDPITVGKIFLYSLPFIIAITAPMAFLTAILAVFGRMSEDFEIIAYKALGINPFRILVPLGFTAFLFVFFMIYFNNHILPDSNHKVKVLLMRVSEIRPAAELAPRSFITSFPGYILYARAIDKTSHPATLEDVLLIEKSEYAPANFVTAQQASITIDNQWNLITFEMNRGQKQVIGEDGIYWEVDFDQQLTNVFLPPEARPDTSHRGDRELSAGQMMNMVSRWQHQYDSLKRELAELQSQSHNQIPQDNQLYSRQLETINNQLKALNDQINKYLVEIHKKYSLPFAAITFIFLGAPLGIKTRKGGMGAAFGIAILITTIFYIFIVGGETLSDRGLIPPFWAMWSANIIFLFIGFWLYLGFFMDNLIWWRK